jgi:hypothetical protein
MGINIDELLLAGPRGRKLLVSVHRNCGPDGCISLPDPGPRQGRGLVTLLPVAMVVLFAWRPFGQLLRCAVLAAIRLGVGRVSIYGLYKATSPSPLCSG